MKTRTKKSILMIVLSLTTAGTIAAQVPEQFNYQARILDGQNLAQGNKTLVFRFFDAATGGTELYSETQIVSAIDGLVSAQIGAANPTAGSLFAVFESNPSIYLELEVEGERLSPRERMLAVPFAFNAQQLDGMNAAEFASASHEHDGADITSGEISRIYIDQNIARDVEIMPTVLANDGTGSGLDADLFGSQPASAYLRSDINQTFAGSLFDVANGLAVGGTLSIGTDDPNDDDAIYFDSGTSEAFFWDDDFGGRFQVTDDFRVQGNLEAAGSFETSGPLSVGTDNGTNDDAIYFDSGTKEVFGWDEGLDGFLLSDDLAVLGLLQANGDVYVGGGSISDDDTLFFDGSAQFLRWMDTAGRFSLSAGLTVESDLRMATTAGDQSIFFYEDFNPTGEVIRWDDSADRFVLSDDVEIQNQLYLGTSDADHSIYVFDSGSATGEYLRWDDSEDEFLVSDTLHVADNLVLGTNDSDHVIYFYDGGSPTAESLRWDDSESEFLFSDALRVNDNVFLHSALFMSSTEGDQAINFYENGAHGGEYLLWDDSLDHFFFSDTLSIGGAIIVSGNAFLDGDAYIDGLMTAGSKSFRIDHPLDPKNKYLYHTSIESPDMKNVYDGVVQLATDGTATVELPSYFEALNRDYRYQLTAIGGAAPELHVASEIADNHFRIAGGKPGLKVSWQVTGIRRDRWANANRTPVEADKPASERGTYLHPKVFASQP